MSTKFLHLARKFALEHEYEPYFEYRLCAVIVKGGKLLSVGYNRPLTNGLTEHYKVAEYCSTTHAEVDAVIKVRNKIDLTGAKMYVARIMYRNNEFGLSRPCEMCNAVLEAYKFKRVFL